MNVDKAFALFLIIMSVCWASITIAVSYRLITDDSMFGCDTHVHSMLSTD